MSTNMDLQRQVETLQAKLTALQEEMAQRTEALRKAEWEKEVILDSQLEHVIYQDLDHKILWANRAACESVNATREDLIGEYCYEIWPQRSERCEDCPVAAAVASGTPQEVEKTTSDGRSWFIRGYPVRDEDGNIVGGIEITQDVTAQKQAETERERMQQEIIEAQREALKELSTPVIPLMDRILVMPLVGSIDSLRAREIMRTVLQGISQYRAKVIILDVTGVAVMDTGIVNHLNKTIQAARLKGARTIVTGISDAVAEAIVDLGIDWGAVETLRDLQTGLRIALEQMGITLQVTGR